MTYTVEFGIKGKAAFAVSQVEAPNRAEAVRQAKMYASAVGEKIDESSKPKVIETPAMDADHG